MHIEIGKYYVNKTWRFLLPCLRGHGDIFVSKFNPVFKLAVAIHDTLLDDSKKAEGRSIYILCDKLANKIAFDDFLDWIKYQDYYIGDYCPDSEILKSRKHVIIIKIPEVYNDAYDHFLKSNFSLMYLDEELKLLFSNPGKKKEYDILSREPKIIEDFVKEVNKEFGSNAIVDDFKNAELELPLRKTEEIFNCCRDGDTVFFNEKLDKIWKN
jgi:hypothetical protein